MFAIHVAQSEAVEGARFCEWLFKNQEFTYNFLLKLEM